MTRRAFTAALLVCVLAAAPGVASARPTTTTAPPLVQRQAEITSQLGTLRGQVSEASQQEADLLDNLDQIQGRRSSLDTRVAAADRLVEAARTDATDAQASLDRFQSEFVGTQLLLQAQNQALAAEHRRLRDRAVAAYIANPSSHAAEMLLQARSLRDIAATAGYLRAVMDVQQQAVTRYTAQRDATDALKARVEVEKDAALRQRNVVVDRLSDLEAKQAEQRAARDELAADEARQAELLDQVRQQKDAFEAQIDALRAESNQVSAILLGLQAGVTVVAPTPGVLASPIPGAPMTSFFGPRVHPILGTVRMHEGVDFGAGMGTPIGAAAAGRVVSAGPLGGYGNATVIDHGNGLATLYGHQSEVFVTPGMTVARGQVIGAVGSTGLSTGPHLHFEVRVKGQPVDPLPYLAAA
ncbi:MAG TPA: peptidoglycan DD-metalloendopeptidase family protein [Acidimicrobiales bacterium]|nr:peptidoglycan DD-metalloendopeptidase family protein [Acidimicrobiales bacterium]